MRIVRKKHKLYSFQQRVHHGSLKKFFFFPKAYNLINFFEHRVKRTAQKFISNDFKFIDLIGDSKLKTADTVEVKKIILFFSYKIFLKNRFFSI